MLIEIHCFGCGQDFLGDAHKVWSEWTKHLEYCELGLEIEEWQRIRKKVLERDRYKCQRCGNKNKLHVHHIKTRKQGGEDKMTNLITLCRGCHQKEHPFPLGFRGRKKDEGPILEVGE